MWNAWLANSYKTLYIGKVCATGIFTTRYWRIRYHYECIAASYCMNGNVISVMFVGIWIWPYPFLRGWLLSRSVQRIPIVIKIFCTTYDNYFAVSSSRLFCFLDWYTRRLDITRLPITLIHRNRVGTPVTYYTTVIVDILVVFGNRCHPCIIKKKSKWWKWAEGCGWHSIHITAYISYTTQCTHSFDRVAHTDIVCWTFNWCSTVTQCMWNKY